MKKTSTWLWGIVLIIIGVVLGINALGVAHINIFFPGWWTLFIIVPCFIGLFGNDNDKTGDLIGLCIGAILLMACLGFYSFRIVWQLALPMILVLVGLSMLFKDVLKKQVMKGAEKLSDADEDTHWATFSGQKLDYDGETFEKADLEAVFGGLDCDLRRAKIKDGAMIKASAIFGGVNIKLPDDVKAKVVSTSIFGGVSDKHSDKAVEDAKKTVFIDATCLFGGVEIK